MPKEIRDQLGLEAGARINVTLLTDGTIILRAKTRRLADLAGMLAKPGRAAVPVERMTPWK